MGASGDRGPPMELGPIPCPRVEHLGEHGDRVPQVDEPEVEWREAEAQDVWRTEVADHPPRDQGLHDRIAPRVTEAHLAAPNPGVAGAEQDEALPPASLFDELDEALRETHRLGPDLGEVAREQHVHPYLERGQREDRRRPAEAARDPGCGAIRAFERERVRMTEPSGERLTEGLVVPRRHV